MAYVEDLMAAQALNDHEVTYFFSGRQYPWLRRPRVRRWRQGSVAMLELVNSPLFDHGRQPELELAEPQIERMLGAVMREVRPHIVHVQELAGLPSSVLDVVHEAGVPTVMTLQDYFPLCPTFKLLDSNEQVCLRRQIGADCVATTAANPRDPAMLFDGTIRYDLWQRKLMQRVAPPRRTKMIKRFAEAAAARAPVHHSEWTLAHGADPAGAFQRRRDANVARLNSADRLIAMSSRVAEIYAHLGVAPDRLRILQLTLAHIEHLTPRRRRVGTPLTFATLAAFESRAKGGQLLLDAVKRLSRVVDQGRFRVLVYGSFEADFYREAEHIDGIEVMGGYQPNELDALLDDIDVGLMTSIWEEAYGYAGVEFLAKGIPVIANAIGGMPEYTRAGETGWLNQSCSAGELAQIMRDVIERPGQISQLNAHICAARHSIIKSMPFHADEMDAIYKEVLVAA